MNAIVRQAQPDEFGEIAALLSSFAPEALSEEERRSGYLQHAFSKEAVERFSRSLGVIVAVDQGAIVGALCAASMRAADLTPPLAALRAHFPEWRIGGHTIDPQTTLAYGPVCIGRTWHGKGLLKRLFAKLIEIAPKDYQMGVAFVAEDNPRSLHAHRDGLGMELLGPYFDRDQKLFALGFSLPSKDIE
jgi:hypothetical protein